MDEDDGSRSGSTPRAGGRTSRRNDEGEELDESTPRKTEIKPKFDPRLWIYRYKAPPQPAAPRASVVPTFEVPLYKEGTIVRIVGKIFSNTTRGYERQIEVSSIEPVYEPGYVNQYRRKVQPKGNKYAEWHHAVNVVVMSIVGVVEYRISYQVGRFVIVIVV